MRVLIIILACVLLSGCVSSSAVYDIYSKGGHPLGKSKSKVKR